MRIENPIRNKKLMRGKSHTGKPGVYEQFPTPQYYIYFIFNKLTREVVYIGETKQGGRRMYLHTKNAEYNVNWAYGLLTTEELKDFDWMWFEDCWDLTDKERKALEREYINKYNTTINK